MSTLHTVTLNPGTWTCARLPRDLIDHHGQPWRWNQHLGCCHHHDAVSTTLRDRPGWMLSSGRLTEADSNA